MVDGLEEGTEGESEVADGCGSIPFCLTRSLLRNAFLFEHTWWFIRRAGVGTLLWQY